MITLSESHKKRIISGLIMAAILLSCLIIGGWPLRIMVSAVAMLALWEFYQMFWPQFSNLPDKAAGFIAGAAICLFAGHSLTFNGILAVIGMLALYAAVRFLFSYGLGNELAKLEDHALVIFGVIYLPLSLHLALYLSPAEQLLVILGTISSDIGAYYAGSNLGKHKLWPKVSPKKSWEGSIGGMLGSIVVVVIMTLFAKIEHLEQVAVWQWAFLGLLLSISAQFGDLFESALKRVRQVKDSSNLIPGHGGVLDRIDSLVFTIPVYVCFKSILIEITLYHTPVTGNVAAILNQM